MFISYSFESKRILFEALKTGQIQKDRKKKRNLEQYFGYTTSFSGKKNRKQRTCTM